MNSSENIERINLFIKSKKIDFIASHGHTIFHQPEKKITLQIGDGKTISQITKHTTINNFRQLDVSLNGQGAPLVPIGDLKLFPDYKYCLNLGGFANISIKKGNKISAFDICPVNIVLNTLARKSGLEYDKNGNIRPQEKDWSTSDKAISARIFKTYRDKVTKDNKYISMRKMWREYENHNIQAIQ